MEYDATTLSKGIGTVTRIMGGDSPLLITGGALVSTNGTLWCEHKIGDDGEGDVLILSSGKRLQQLLDGCTGNVQLKLKGEHIKMDGSIKANLNTWTVDSATFLRPPNEAPWRPLPNTLDRITYASNDTFKSIYIFNVGAICVDGLRASLIISEGMCDKPVALLAFVAARLPDMDEIAASPERIALRSETTTVSVPTSSEQMPQAAEIFLKAPSFERKPYMKVNRVNLMRLVNAVGTLSDIGKSRPTRLVSDSDTLQIVARGNQVGNGNASIPITETSGGLDVWVNATYLTQALSNCASEEVEMWQTPSIKNAHLWIQDGNLYHIAMAMVYPE